MFIVYMGTSWHIIWYIRQQNSLKDNQEELSRPLSLEFHMYHLDIYERMFELNCQQIMMVK
jgi:hypothetical protein